MRQIKEIKIEEKKVKRKQLITKCPFCDQEIKGTSKSQVLYNLDNHLRAKHKEEKQ